MTTIDEISASFNYEQKVKNVSGKLWVEHYPAWLWIYAHLMIDRNTRVHERCSGGDRLLDIGCGMGDLLYLLEDRYCELVGIDPSEAMVAQAIENMSLRGLAERTSVSRGLAESLEFASASFDTVIMLDVYEHILPEQRMQALSEVHRILRPGGEFFLVTPSRAELLWWNLLDQIFSLPIWLIRRKRTGKLWGLETRDFTEEFCSKSELLRDVQASKLKLARFERVGFYPAAETPGAFGIFLRLTNRIPGLHRLIRATFQALSLIPFMNQKMFVRCIKP